MIRNISVLLFSLLISVLVVELLVRVVMPQDLSGTWRVYSDDGLYLLNKSEGRAQHEKDDIKLVYKFAKPHLRVNDSFTLVEASRLDSENQALVLGDSFSFGWLLPFEHTYVSRLEQSLSNEGESFRFLNAAAGGWGAADYIAYYDDYGELLSISSVIVFLNTDDIARAFKSPLYVVDSETELKRAEPIIRKGLKSKVSGIPLYGWLLEHSHLMQAVRSVLMVAISPKQTDDVSIAPQSYQTPHSTLAESDVAVAVAHGKKLFIHLKELARERGHRLVVVTTGWQAFSEENTTDPSVVFFDQAEAFFAEQGINFIDTSKQVRDQTAGEPAPYSIQGDHHPNAEGAKLIADVVYPRLSRFLLNK